MLTRIFAIVALSQIVACQCGEKPQLEGHVVDLWGQPVKGINVQMSGFDKSTTSNGKGAFTFPLMSGEHTLKATGEGYIPGEQAITVKSVDAPMKANIRVIPEPETDGFHIVGPDSYLKIPPQQVLRQGNDLKTYQGIQSVGEVEVGGKELRVVFHTPLKMDQVARLGIELHKLSFTEKSEVATVDGEEEVALNLWQSAGKIPLEREELGSDDNYVYRVDDLPSGSYAFVSMKLLDPVNASAFDKVPANVRRIHSFTVE